MFVILHTLQRAKAQDYCENQETTNNSKQITDYINTLSKHSMQHNSLILLLTLTVCLTYKFFKWLRTSKNIINCNQQRLATTNIYVTIGNNTNNITIKWKSLHILSHRIKLSHNAEDIQYTITIIPFCLYKLKMSTPEKLELIIDDTDIINVKTSTYISISVTKAIWKFQKA